MNAIRLSISWLPYLHLAVTFEYISSQYKWDHSNEAHMCAIYQGSQVIVVV